VAPNLAWLTALRQPEWKKQHHGEERKATECSTTQTDKEEGQWVEGWRGVGSEMVVTAATMVAGWATRRWGPAA
jgi:hypothetical protein